MHTKKRWIWTNTTLIMASICMLGVDYKHDCMYMYHFCYDCEGVPLPPLDTGILGS